jgi:uncharacterized protein YjiS (DUF1127 family)
MTALTQPIALQSAALPPLSRLVFALAGTVLAWETRRQTRRALARLEPQHLRDIGLTARDAATEAAKPVWRG